MKVVPYLPSFLIIIILPDGFFVSYSELISVSLNGAVSVNARLVYSASEVMDWVEGI